MSDRTYDSRYCYSVGCTWHDSIHKVGNTGPSKMLINGRPVESNGLPCCPFCGSMLFETEHKKNFFESAAKHAETHPGYLEFVEWSQGKCFRDFDASIAAYNKFAGTSHTRESFGFAAKEESN